MTSDNDGAAARQIWVTLAFVSFGTLLGQLLVAGYALALGYDLGQLRAGGPAALSAGELAGALALGQAFGYLLPGVAAAVTLYRGRWLDGVHLRPLPRPAKLAYALLAFLGTLYLTGALAALNATVELAGWQADIERDVAGFLDRLINAEGPGGLAAAVLVIALLPALGEELVFRGLLQPALVARLRSPHLGIWLTGIAFGAVHLQFAGLLPRVFLGVVLGFLAFYSQRLWVPILAHALFNGAQVVAVRAGALDAVAPGRPEAPDTATLLLAVGLAAISLVSLLPLARPDPGGGDGDAPVDDASTFPPA